MANEGKKFEEDFQKSFKGLAGSVTIERLYDTMQGRRGVKNPCDYICYSHPNIFYFELKSYLGKSIPVDAVSKNQYAQLMDRAKVKGAVSGLVLNYRLVDKVTKTTEFYTFFLPITEYDELVKLELRSISLLYCLENCIRLGSKQVRTRRTYFIPEFMAKIKERFDGHHSGK